MRRYRVDVELSVPAEAVVALLGSRPTAWLRRFLCLATLPASAGVDQGAPAWYRLGAPTRDGPGRAVAALSWFPHLDGDLFTSFKGHIVVHSAGRGVVLELEGETAGGTPARNDLALRRLLDLIAAALAADHGAGG
jgi:hypothetical protein